jgi:hypothetical protein
VYPCLYTNPAYQRVTVRMHPHDVGLTNPMSNSLRLYLIGMVHVEQKGERPEDAVYKIHVLEGMLKKECLGKLNIDEKKGYAHGRMVLRDGLSRAASWWRNGGNRIQGGYRR